MWFLRGINVSGHHKVPMAVLQTCLQQMGCREVHTLLNSGNALFEYTSMPEDLLELRVEDTLSRHFGFAVPALIWPLAKVEQLVLASPFVQVAMHKDIHTAVCDLRKTASAL